MEPAHIETVYLASGPTADEWVDYGLTGGALVLFVIALPLLRDWIKDESKDTSNRLAWLLAAIPGAFLLPVVAVSVKAIFFDYPGAIADYHAHRYQIVAGCLSGFNAGNGHSFDDIKVAGRTFSYNDSTVVTGFHQAEVEGGPIHAESWVRLFVVGDSIVRVDVAQGACPPAPRFTVS